jgi:hypothetical protein
LAEHVDAVYGTMATHYAAEEARDKQHFEARDAYDGSSMSSDEAQAGVKGVEAVALTWTYWSLVAAYVG